MTAAEADYEDFVGATAPALRRTAYLMCGDWHRAEDATQDALVKVYLRWSRLERGGALRGYAHRAVTTAVIDQSRRPWRRERSTDAPPAAAATGDAGDPTRGTDRRLAVVGALRQLAPRQRACVVLRYYADLPVAEVAGILGVDPGTVKSQTARALARLRTALVDQGVDLVLEDLL
jgi:RNA polymerase sigma-70 factor (sigma-E family)